jgi:hypothetical protein
MVNHYADLLGIQKAGELVEIELEDTGKTTAKGAKKWKLVGYPGWSAPVAQGGKAQANATTSSYGGSWYNSEEGVRFTQERTNRRTALMQAVTATAKDEESFWLLADAMYAWLQEREEGQQDAEVPITERTTDPIPASTPPSPVLPGEGQERDGGVAKEGAVSPGGEGAASSDADNPWAGFDVVPK